MTVGSVGNAPLDRAEDPLADRRLAFTEYDEVVVGDLRDDGVHPRPPVRLLPLGPVGLDTPVRESIEDNLSDRGNK